MNLTDLQALFALTLSNPRAAARSVMDQRLTDANGWTALLLAAVLTAVLGFVGQTVMPGEVPEPFATIMSSPLRMAVVQVISMVATVLLAWAVGRRFGGQGSLADSLALIAWVQVPMIVLQVVQVASALLLPPLAPLLGIAAFVLYVVLLTLFVAELHGFKSALRVFGGIVATSLLAALPVAIMMLAILGAPPNV